MKAHAVFDHSRNIAESTPGERACWARRCTASVLPLFLLLMSSSAFAWDTSELVSKGTIWSEFVPDREGRIVLGISNEVLFAGISHHSLGGDYGSPVYALVQYGEFTEQTLTANHPITLDQYDYEWGLPVALELASDSNGNRAVTYTVHWGSDVIIRCATRYGTNGWALDDVVPPFSFTPYTDSVSMDSAIVDGRATLAHVVGYDERLYWSVHPSGSNWTTELVATNAQGPIRVAVSPEGIPTISFMEDGDYRWAFRSGGSWSTEVITTGLVSSTALAFDRNGSVATVYRPGGGSNLLYAVRGTFGGWHAEEILTPTSSNAGHVDMDYSEDNLPSLAYADAYTTYFAQRTAATQWNENTVSASTCGVYDSPPCFYSWQYRGREPDLLYLTDGSPIILHHGYSGNYKVSSRNYIYYTSWAPMRETPWEWVYHDDADDLDDRVTIWVPASGTYALNHTEVVDSDDVSIRMLTSTQLQNLGGQMWVHWWNGSVEHWVRGYPEQQLVLQPGDLNGLPLAESVPVVQWKCDIGSALTEPGLNYYAIQIKVGSTLPLGGEVFDEDWLLREVAGTQEAVTNLLGQAMSEIPDFVGHDWPVIVYSDLDGDKIPDYWEEAHGLSPTNAADALIDSDGDGLSNAEEYGANTIPTNGQSYFAVDEFSIGSPIVVTFFGFSNRLYTLESCLADFEAGGGLAGPWQPYPTYIRVPGSNALQTAIGMPSGTNEFFRIRVHLP